MILKWAKYVSTCLKYLLVQFHFLWSKVTPVYYARGKVGAFGFLAYVEHSLMCMNGGLYSAAIKLSDRRKLESLNVTRVSGSITQCCLPCTSLPCGLNYLMSFSLEIREQNAYRQQLPDSTSSGIQSTALQLDDLCFLNRDY